MSVSIEAQAITSENSQVSVGSVCDADGASRSRLLESSIAVVEDLRGAVVRVRKSPENFSADFQVCLPYRGLFVWHVADNAVVGDANQVLFVSGGESYFLSQPVASDYAELIITPDLELLTELSSCRRVSDGPSLVSPSEPTGGPRPAVSEDTFSTSPDFQRVERNGCGGVGDHTSSFSTHRRCRELRADRRHASSNRTNEAILGSSLGGSYTAHRCGARRGCLTGISHGPLSASRRGPAAWVPYAVTASSGPRRASERL